MSRQPGSLFTSSACCQLNYEPNGYGNRLIIHNVISLAIQVCSCLYHILGRVYEELIGTGMTLRISNHIPKKLTSQPHNTLGLETNRLSILLFWGPRIWRADSILWKACNIIDLLTIETNLPSRFQRKKCLIWNRMPVSLCHYHLNS